MGENIEVGASGGAPQTVPVARLLYRRYTKAEIGRHRRAVVAALVSGRYRKNEGQLRDGDRYCAEGVICDVSGLGRWVQIEAGRGWHYYIRDDRSYSAVSLPKEALRWLGEAQLPLRAQRPDGDGTERVSELNDAGVPLSGIGLGLALSWRLEFPDEWWRAQRLADAGDDDGGLDEGGF